MPKVVLFNPQANYFTMPLALLHLASSLASDGHEVAIVDGRIEGDPVASVAKEVEDALCLGVTVLSGKPIRSALTVSREIKRHFPALPVIWGGWHPTLFPQQCLSEECVEYVAIGQGEVLFREFVGALSRGGDCRRIAGVAHKIGGKVQINPARKLVDMNHFPSVDYSLIDLERYFKRKGKREVDYCASLGCRNYCAFCADPLVFGRQRTSLDINRVVNELKILTGKYDLSHVSFQDDNLFNHWSEYDLFSRLVIEHDCEFQWAGTMHASIGAVAPEPLFAQLSRSGLRRLIIGVESGSEKMLKKLKKGITLDQVLRCADFCGKYDISVLFPFIVGLPDETDADIELTLDFAESLLKLHPNFSVPIFRYEAYPGSALAEEYHSKDRPMPMTLEDWSAFDYVEGKAMLLSDAVEERIRTISLGQRLPFECQEIP